ncbi:hypothetical protein DdX_05850 [Ditylenchus destructor]|uniref:Uncharacterized protein n=1 Tax=Ditylenchus destructor TaxID=166010 RepID=A0AAD4NBF5_9BILA|nr:hypothetical protein DdX_05850 [Ditylenchus destructor]
MDRNNVILVPQYAIDVPNNEEENAEQDLAVSQAWRDVSRFERDLARNQRTVCCCGCASVETLLASLSFIWALNSFIINASGSTFERYEVMLSYVIAFCMIAGLIATTSRWVLVGVIFCVLDLLWNILLLIALMRVKWEAEADPIYSFATEYLLHEWPDMLISFKSKVLIDYYGNVAHFVLKIAFICSIYVTSIQLYFVKQSEKRLHDTRHQLGELMNLRMHAADVVSPVIINNDSESHHTAISPDSMLDTVSTQCPSIISIPSSFFRTNSSMLPSEQMNLEEIEADKVN